MNKLLKKVNVSKDSMLFFAGMLFASFFHYLYTVAMGKMLTPKEYGTFMALLSIILVTTFSFTTFQTVTTKNVAEFYAREKFFMIKTMALRMIKHVVALGCVISFFFAIGSSFISDSLKVGSIVPVLVLASAPVPLIILPIVRGVLQGLHLFKALGLNLIIEGFSRFVTGIILVYFGLSVSGALAATPISGVIAFLLCLFPVFFVFKKHSSSDTNNEKIDFISIYKFTIPVFITQFCMTVIPFIDIIFVKKYFVAHEAGIYASAQTIGKIIYFLPMPITLLMFPKVAYSFTKGEDIKPLLLKSLAAVVVICGMVNIVFNLFPNFIVRQMFKAEYLPAVPLLKFFGISMSLFSIANILIFFQLSIERINFVVLLVFMTIVQIILLFLFHNTLYQILYILIFCGLALVVINLAFSLLIANKRM